MLARGLDGDWSDEEVLEGGMIRWRWANVEREVTAASANTSKRERINMWKQEQALNCLLSLTATKLCKQSKDNQNK